MAVKTTFVILLLGIAGIFEVQAASIAAENDLWKNLDEDKRDVEEDNIDPAKYLPTDDLEYEDLASDFADDFDYYKDAIESRTVACRDVFGPLCKKLAKSDPQCTSTRRNFLFAKRFCLASCAQFCK